MPATLKETRMRPDYLAMVAAESPQSLEQTFEDAAADAQRSLVAPSYLRIGKPLSRFDEARWLIRECGFRL